MEKWIEVYKGMIPNDNYKVWLTNSEEKGLDIELRGNNNCVKLKFGFVQAVRMLDEGIVQDGVYLESELDKYRENFFENVIYELQEGEFKEEIQKMSAGYMDAVEIKHYLLITGNFNIDIITEWEPELCIGCN